MNVALIPFTIQSSAAADPEGFAFGVVVSLYLLLCVFAACAAVKLAGFILKATSLRFYWCRVFGLGLAFEVGRIWPGINRMLHFKLYLGPLLVNGDIKLWYSPRTQRKT